MTSNVTTCELGLREPSTPRQLGKGAFGIVYEKVWKEMKVAVKRIDKTEFMILNESVVDTTSAGQRSEEELMKNLHHPNVLKLLHVECDSNFKYFFLELCEATIGDYCKGKYTGQMPPSEAHSLSQMTSGLAYIHAKGLVHRDIKEENVLIYKSASEETWLKISDFGLSKPISASGSYSLKSGVKGTRNFFSPELLRLADQEASFDNIAHQRSNKSSDVFALGCLFYSYLTKGKHPFADQRGTFFIPINILEGKFNLAELPDLFYDPIIEGMILSDPYFRLGLDDVERMLQPRLS